MPIRPLHDSVLVKRDELKEEKTPAGIIIPDSARTPLTRGVVVGIGRGVPLKGSFEEVTANCIAHRLTYTYETEGARPNPDGIVRRHLLVKPGDRVLFTKWQETEIEVDGEKLVAMKEDDILGVIEEL